MKINDLSNYFFDDEDDFSIFESDNDVQENNKYGIKFGCLDLDEEYINPSLEWDRDNNSMGLFLITRGDEEILYKTLKLQNEAGEVIWQSRIKEVPSKYNLVEEDYIERLYITERVLSADYANLEAGNHKYRAFIDGEEEYFVKVRFFDFTRSVGNGDKEEPKTGEYVGTKSVDDECDSVNENGRTIVINEKENKSKYIINCMLDYLPLSIDIRKNNPTSISNNEIIIEKLGNHYVTLNNIDNRVQCVLFDENQYYEFDGGINEYIKKIKSKICKQYMLSGKAFDSLTKLVIVDNDEAVEELTGENVTVLRRREALDNISENNSVIMDIGSDALNILYYDEDNNLVNIVSNALGLNNGEEVLEQITNIYTMLKDDSVLLTGLSIVPEIYSTIVNSDEGEFNFACLATMMTNK